VNGPGGVGFRFTGIATEERVMAKATQAFMEWDDETGRAIAFEPGDPVPDYIAARVGDHVVDQKPDPQTDPDATAFDGEAFDAAVDAKVAVELEQAREEAAAEQREREQAAVDALDPEDPYDPSEHSAAEVKEYLSGLDTDTVAGQAEYDRVVAAEQAGKNRSTAIPEE
jgi:hypothetical protein